MRRRGFKICKNKTFESFYILLFIRFITKIEINTIFFKENPNYIFNIGFIFKKNSEYYERRN